MFEFVLFVVFLAEPHQPIKLGSYSTPAACKAAEKRFDAIPLPDDAKQAGATALCLVVSIPEGEQS